MKITRKRLAPVLCLSLLAGVLAAPAAPAAAADLSLNCITVLQSTPTLNVDLDNDGNPDVRAPRIYDVKLCSDHTLAGDVHEPRTAPCSAGFKVTCIEVYVTVLPVSAGAYAEAAVCFSVTGLGQTCIPVPPVQTYGSAPETVCIGIDLEGGPDPCSY